jgi:hypothetical protein
VALVPKKQKDNERGINYPGGLKTADSSRGHKISTRYGSVIDSDLTYTFLNMDRSSHGVFVSKNQSKVNLYIYIYFRSPLELPTPQDCQPHPLVPSLAASTF